MEYNKKSWAMLTVLAAGVWGCNEIVGAEPPSLGGGGDGGDIGGVGAAGGAAGEEPASGPGGADGQSTSGPGGADGQSTGGLGGADGQFTGGSGGAGGGATTGSGGADGEECDPQDGDCVCGDGDVDPGEECDDGGIGDGDACSSACEEQRVLQVEAGNTHVCALLNHGKVKCWGNYQWLGLGDLGNSHNHRGDAPGEMGATLEPVNLGAGLVAVEIAAGATHMCARFDDGKVKCWGANNVGQLGLGNTLNRGLDLNKMGDNLPYVKLGTGRTAKSLTAGGNHTCALLDNGAVKCWGANGAGQLGLGNTEHRGDEPGEMDDDLTPVNLGHDLVVQSLSSGATHTCALFTSGKVKCWGGNASGQLGLGDTDARGDGPSSEMGNNLKFVALGIGQTATTISAGWGYTCAVLTGGALKCWGNSSSGQLGYGNTKIRGDQPGEMGDNLPAINLGAGETAVAVATSSGNGERHHTCALLTGGQVKCWGANNKGQLGLGFKAQLGDESGEMGANLPLVQLGAGKAAVALSLGASKDFFQNAADEYIGAGYTCALFADGSTKCWGAGGYGVLGQGSITSLGDNGGEMGDNLPTIKLFSSQW